MGFFDRFKPKPSQPSCPPELIEELSRAIIDGFVEGEFATRLPSNVVLKKGERLIIDIPNVVLAEERAKTRGSYGGFTIRVARGFSVHTGGFEGARETSLVRIDEGSFALTNKRVVFTGAGQTRNFKLSTINSFVLADDGIGINRGSKTKTEYYLGTTQVVMLYTMEPEEHDDWAPTTVEWKLEGRHIQEIIQRLIQGP